jgi:serine/threonine protein kinase
MLDQGAYGQVYVRNGKAVKLFKKLNHAVQEYVALMSLSFTKRVVKVYSCHLDLEKPTITMELLDGNLAEWYNNLKRQLAQGYITSKRYDELMLNALQQLLEGICEIHDYKLTHGDIKPGNILIKKLENNNVEVFIGDCGFVSLSRYSKTDRTARPYRDPNPQHHYGHDIYSYAIIFLQLYGRANIYNQVNDTNILIDIIKETIDNKKHKDILLAMVQPDADDRPTARECLLALFNVKLPKFKSPIQREFIGKILTEEEKKDVRGFLLKYTNKYDLNHGHKSYSALIFYLQSEKIMPNYHCLYCIALLYILSAVFAHSSKNFTWNDIKKLCYKNNYTSEEALEVLSLLVNNIEFIQLLMYEK